MSPCLGVKVSDHLFSSFVCTLLLSTIHSSLCCVDVSSRHQLTGLHAFLLTSYLRASMTPLNFSSCELLLLLLLRLTFDGKLYLFYLFSSPGTKAKRC